MFMSQTLKRSLVINFSKNKKPRHAPNAITYIITVNTYVQHTISFFEDEVDTVFMSENISLVVAISTMIQ